MTERAPNEKIAERIHKLLKLAKGNTTEGEADAAMAKVQELLGSYNLTMADVEAHNATPSDESKRTKGGFKKNAMYRWQQDLMGEVARVHYCLHFVHEEAMPDEGKKDKMKVRKVHSLIGREVNVITAQAMFDYLIQTINRLVSERFPHSEILSKSANSWKEGCAARLRERLSQRAREADERQKAQAEAAPWSPETTGKALVLLSDIRKREEDLNMDFRYGWAPGTWTAKKAAWAAEDAARRAAPAPEVEAPKETDAQRRKREEKEARERARWRRKWERQEQQERERIDWDAYREGAERGKRIGLDPQVDQPTERQVIGK